MCLSLGSWLNEGAVAHGKDTEASKFHAPSLRQGFGDLVQNRVDDLFGVGVVEMGIACGDQGNEFGFYHL